MTKRKKKFLTLVLSFILFLTLALPSGLVFAEDRSIQVNFTVDEIQNAGIEDRNFAKAIYDSINAQPNKFLSGNTLESNTYTSMEELLNSFTGDVNASGTGKADVEKISSIEGITMLKSLSSLDLQDNKITNIIPLAATDAREEGDLKPEEKLYYGQPKKNMDVMLQGNPITTYPAYLGGRMYFPVRLSSSPVFLQPLVFISVSDGTVDFTKNYDFPLNLWRNDERVFLDAGITSIVHSEGNYVNSPKVSPATLGGKLENIEIVDINQTGNFFLMLASYKDSQINWNNWNGSFVDTAILESASLSWFYPFVTEIYSKIEKGTTDTNHSVSLQKLGKDDNQPKAGAEYSLYKKVNDELIAEKLVTDKDGLLKVDSLEAADYYFVETKAPQGYELDPTPIEFTIENGSIDILGGSGNKLTPTDGEEQTIDGTFVLSGSDEAPASVVINEPTNGTFDTLTLEWTEGNQGGTAGKVVYQLGTGTSTNELVYVASKEEAEQKALDKLKECRDLYQNVKISASFNQKIELNQMDEPAVTVDKTITKIWDDNDNQDKIRPTKVKVQLYADDTATGDAITLNADNRWTYTWTNLARFADTKEIVYSIKEVEIPDGYTEKVEIDKDGNFILTNTYTPSLDNPTTPENPTNPEQPVKPNQPTSPSKPNTDAPPTGDTTNLGVLIVALLGSAGLQAFGLLKQRKRDINKK